jgi:hypothetical protein
MTETTTPRLNYVDALEYRHWSTGDERTCQHLLGLLIERHEWSWHMFDGDGYFRGQQREFELNRIVRVLNDRGFVWAHQMLDGARDAHNAAMERINAEYVAKIAASKYVPPAGAAR